MFYGINDEDEPTREEKDAQLRLAMNRTVAKNYSLVKKQKLEMSKTTTEFRLKAAKEKRDYRKNKFIQDRIEKVDRRKAHVLERFHEYCEEMNHQMATYQKTTWLTLLFFFRIFEDSFRKQRVKAYMHRMHRVMAVNSAIIGKFMIPLKSHAKHGEEISTMVSAKVTLNFLALQRKENYIKSARKIVAVFLGTNVTVSRRVHCNNIFNLFVRKIKKNMINHMAEKKKTKKKFLAKFDLATRQVEEIEKKSLLPIKIFNVQGKKVYMIGKYLDQLFEAYWHFQIIQIKRKHI